MHSIDLLYLSYMLIVNNATNTNNSELNRLESVMKTFKSKIARKNLQIRGTTPADGNCFFWAVSDQLDSVHKLQKTQDRTLWNICRVFQR